MKRFALICASFLTLARLGYCVGVFFENTTGLARNGRTVLVTPTPTLVTAVNNQDHTLVALNDDMENTIYYGDSTCGTNTAQKINPMEKVTFPGISQGFSIYVCTANGSAELRLVENP